jgi:hypothetical protein
MIRQMRPAGRLLLRPAAARFALRVTGANLPQSSDYVNLPWPQQKLCVAPLCLSSRLQSVNRQISTQKFFLLVATLLKKSEQAGCQSPLRAKRQSHAACSRLKKQLKRKKLIGSQLSFTHKRSASRHAFGRFAGAISATSCGNRRAFRPVERKSAGASGKSCKFKIIGEKRTALQALPTLSVALSLRFSAFICCSFAASICSARCARICMVKGKALVRVEWRPSLAGRRLPLCGQALRAFALSRSVTALCRNPQRRTAGTTAHLLFCRLKLLQLRKDFFTSNDF